MKQFFNQLSTWWFTHAVPIQGPLTTIEARETLRKRRLLSLLLLIGLFTSSIGELINVVSQFNILQHLIMLIPACIFLLALWANKRGYLKTAAFICISVQFAGLALINYTLPLLIPITMFTCWASWPFLLVISGLFLPAWAPILIALLEMIFMYWLVFYGHHAQVAITLHSVDQQQGFFLYTCMVIILMALISAIYAFTTKRAVIQADRATELELAHQTISQAYATIQQQALTDALTGLPNHRAMIDQLTKEVGRAQRYDRPFSVLFFDGDRFKRVNDTYGHAAGDAVLQQIADRVTSTLRGGDILGRFGGEEFVVLLPEADANDAAIIAERMRATVASQPMLLPTGEEQAISVSIGLASYPTDGTSETDLLSQADGAMYIAKRLGRNQIRTAQEAREINADVDMLAILQQEGLSDASEREGKTPEQLKDIYMYRAIYSLMALLDRRDTTWSAHAYAVSDIAVAIAQVLEIAPGVIARIGLAALLHDIGKIVVPDVVLHKTTPLTLSEHLQMQGHTELAAQILQISPFFHDLIEGVRHHHERWDGTGYPDEKAGEDIPLAARIIAVAEAYDAMQRDYPYQLQRSAEQALAEVQRAAGSQFDPQVVEALLTTVQSASIPSTTLATSVKLESSMSRSGNHATT